MKHIPRILRYVWPHWRLAVASVVFTILVSLVGLLTPWSFKLIVDNVLGNDPMPPVLSSWFGLQSSSKFDLLIIFVIAGLLITLLENVLTVLNEYAQTKLGQWMTLDFRSDLFQQLQRLSLAFHDKNSSGGVIYEIAQSDAAAGVVLAFLPLAQSIVTLVGMFWVSYLINPKLALISLVVLPLLYYLVGYYVTHIQERLRRVRHLEGGLVTMVHEVLAMLRVIVAFGREHYEYRRFRQQGEVAARERTKLTVRQTLFALTVNMTTAGGTSLVVGFGAYEVLNGRLTVGELLVVIAYIAAVYKPLEAISYTISGLQENLVAIRMQLTLLDRKPDIVDHPDARDVDYVTGRIHFEDVSFSYDARVATLNGITFEAGAGQVVAIVGPTGAGKTTLISLIPRFYEGTQGRILLDGVDIRKLKLASLRQQISIVQQEPLLFAGTIADNIRYGRLEATEDDMIEAAKAANAHDFITRLPKGYETQLGERGAGLSGGERQRVCIARAFLKDAPILILDEPTSSIDSKTEAVILDALERLMVGRTTLMVAHRLSTIRNADVILAMQGGTIAEMGTHEELLQANGLYRQLYDLQTAQRRRRLYAANEDSPADESLDAQTIDGEPESPSAAQVDAEAILASGALKQQAGDPASEAGSAAEATSLSSQAQPPAPAPPAAHAVLSHEEEPAALPPTLTALPQAATSSPQPLPGVAPLAVAKPKIVLLGMMSKMPVAGIVWLTMQHVVGLKRLGYDVYYVECHARTPSMFMNQTDDDGSALAAAFIDQVMRRFDLAGKWAYQALHADGHCYGMSDVQLRELYQSAALVINLHGGTEPRPEHYATNNLVYLGTDPVQIEIELYHNQQSTIDYLAPHCAFFTWGENYGNPDCGVPFSERFLFKPTRQPVLLDLWAPYRHGPAELFTTIGNWRQPWRELTFKGEIYHWSKHHEFLKIMDLPRATPQAFELALSGYEPEDLALLHAHGWRTRDSLSFTRDIDDYARYIGSSRGEFTVAKDQNVRLRSGWFSDRSATYLAAGRPVITQETGFSNILPTGAGLFGFATLDDVLAAVETINHDYERASRSALEIAREHFSYDVVLPRMLAEVGLARAPLGGGRAAARPTQPFASDLVLKPISRHPTTLPEPTVLAVLATPLPQHHVVSSAEERPVASIVVVTLDNLVFTRLCLESVLAHTTDVRYELIIVDNGSQAETTSYLRTLADGRPQLRVVYNDENRGFAAASNQGLAVARGEALVLLNNDTIVPPGWLPALLRHLGAPGVGMVGPVTNRTCNEAQIETAYSTYGELLSFARDYTTRHRGEAGAIGMLAMFCVALRRETYLEIGPLDEGFGKALFEDDDYAMRLKAAGYQLVYAHDAFVHHFGQASVGLLAATEAYGTLWQANRERFEQKWGTAWQPHQHHVDLQYQILVEQVRQLVQEKLPRDSTVLVISKGDDELLNLGGRVGWHFPQDEDGVYAGYYPGDSDEAISQLEMLRRKGATYLLIPTPSLWWLEYYQGFEAYLRAHYVLLLQWDAVGVLFALSAHAELGRSEIECGVTPSLQ